MRRRLGKPLAVTDSDGNAITDESYAAVMNPLRYRGYVYDADTGFYYLQSRYYDPTLGRFISADSYSSTGTGIIGYNMFAYCNNNPVMCMDPAGTFAQVISEGVRLLQELWPYIVEAGKYIGAGIGVLGDRSINVQWPYILL